MTLNQDTQKRKQHITTQITTTILTFHLERKKSKSYTMFTVSLFYKSSKSSSTYLQFQALLGLLVFELVVVERNVLVDDLPVCEIQPQSTKAPTPHGSREGPVLATYQQRFDYWWGHFVHGGQCLFHYVLQHVCLRRR